MISLESDRVWPDERGTWLGVQCEHCVEYTDVDLEEVQYGQVVPCCNCGHDLPLEEAIAKVGGVR